MKYYVECQNCGKLHFVIKQEDVSKLQEDEIFSKRSFLHCANCGSKNHFKEVTESYVNNFSDGNQLYPILLENEKRAT